MNRESNGYTLVYISVMVVLVALMLAFTSQSLRPRQLANEEIDKMKQILRSIHVDAANNEAQSKYKELIMDAFLVNHDGEKTPGDAFATDLAAELAKPETERCFPVYVANVEGSTKYIMAMRGAGLWGPVWGYISVNDDRNTVFGADFGHAGETPGLGAEIEHIPFSRQFTGKKFFNAAGQFVSIAVVKPGKSAAGQDYVDGISGGTITSQGVDRMIHNSIGAYEKFLAATTLCTSGESAVDEAFCDNEARPVKPLEQENLEVAPDTNKGVHK